ncbi:hypothetical protein VPNG_00326 [Cytospora leucostoma]|uniref:Conidiation-specific protein 8 n=1 Tax=Cytospora leucostoma TaxID=1230097 RepID=A0A423XP77_9PEZI|nr:hypothetical protein VPNG_00326 [Cytospora leucostoma]
MDAPKADRSDSISSTASSTAPLSTTQSGGRRASGPLFASLQEHKRPNDPASVARRQSLHEQRPPTGFIGKMWNNWVRGPQPPS